MMPFVDAFDPLIVSFEVGLMKPGRAIFDTLSRTSGIPHEQIFFTDDYPANVEAARSAGMQAVQFTGVDQLLADFERVGIDV
jgi:HAD superfamily hydrolase (TIGR01509 family)